SIMVRCMRTRLSSDSFMRDFLTTNEPCFAEASQGRHGSEDGWLNVSFLVLLYLDLSLGFGEGRTGTIKRKEKEFNERGGG
ncbi:MAG: hypothetical protein KDK74_03135, partial [Cephaloticoccus sp.]|nr:hypothetical protein [Cephaloticoccus sp.]